MIQINATKQITYLASALISMGALVACGENVTDVEYNIDEPKNNIPSPTLAEREQCFGIALAQFNDCSTAKSHCAGTSSIDYQSDRWKYTKRGTCEEAGGSLQSKKDERIK